MGSTAVARMDVAAVSAAAREYESAAGIVDGALRNRLAGLRFSGVAAGRAHGAAGERVAVALDELSVALRLWSRAAAEISVALRASAQRYREAEASAVDRLV
ncbi:MAG: ESX-1 secretion-associated protein [Actinomycetota bacterium]|nr:ESX-1 secretion-associated protein [Actinomycetota bacterium]